MAADARVGQKEIEASGLLRQDIFSRYRQPVRKRPAVVNYLGQPVLGSPAFGLRRIYSGQASLHFANLDGVAVNNARDAGELRRKSRGRY